MPLSTHCSQWVSILKVVAHLLKQTSTVDFFVISLSKSSMSPLAFRFRLRFASKQEGKFAFEEPEVATSITESLKLELAARNAASLDKATSYHIDAGGFASEQAARNAAEALRVRLRLLNAILNLGLNIPTEDKVTAQVSEAIKKSVQTEHGATAIDSIWGISIYPDNGLHFEYVFDANIEVRPSNPSYIFDGLKELWNLEISLDSASETSLHILGLATQETTDKAAFLSSYLALEQLIDRKPRSETARRQIRRFQQELIALSAANPEALTGQEVQSLNGALAALNEESFSSALTRFGRSITAPALIKGVTPPKFLSACIDARNKIAHKAEPSSEIALGELAAGLRKLVLGLIWARNKLPPFSLNTPPSALRVPAGGMQIRIM